MAELIEKMLQEFDNGNMEAVNKILDLHSVPNYTQNGSIYADSMEAGTEVFEKVENVTGWSRSQLYAWLGY